jgi:hypothetical protein
MLGLWRCRGSRLGQGPPSAPAALRSEPARFPGFSTGSRPTRRPPPIISECCTFAGNLAEYDGGGIHFGRGAPVLRYTIVDGNHSSRGVADEIYALNQGPEPECFDPRRDRVYGRLDT